MAFSVNLLTTASDCDVALVDARSDKRALDRRVYNLGYSAEDAVENSVERAAALAAADAEVTALTSIIGTLPAGDLKAKQQTALRRATDRRDELADSRVSGPIATLARELDLAQAQAELAVVNAFIADVEARKAAI